VPIKLGRVASKILSMKVLPILHTS